VPHDRSRVLLPLAFCRECGQEYDTVVHHRRERLRWHIYVPCGIFWKNLPIAKLKYPLAPNYAFEYNDGESIKRASQNDGSQTNHHGGDAGVLARRR
jgi:hypothetical protein